MGVLRFAVVAVIAGLVGCSSTPSPEPRVAAPVPTPPLADKPVAFANEAAPTTAPARGVAGPSFSSIIRDVAEAPNMDAAVDAYAAGLAMNPDSAALHRAYLRRTVDLGVPQLAVSAADRLITDEPNNGLARAVLANEEALQGNFVDALTDISLAVPRAGDEPFVQVTAAHLLAWYDNNPNAPALPAYTRRSFSQAHAALDDVPAFADAYRDASNFYREERRAIANAGPTTQPTTTAPSTAAPTDATSRAEPAGDVPSDGGGTTIPGGSGGGGYVRYTQAPAAPVYYDGGDYAQGYADGAYDYAYPYFYGWGFYPGFVIFDSYRNHRHYYDHHRDGRYVRNIDDDYRHRYFGTGGGRRGMEVSHGGRGGTLTDGRHFEDLRRRVDGFGQIGSAVRTGNRGSTLNAGARFRGLNPSDPHFRSFNNGNTGSAFNLGQLGNPGPLTNLPGPRADIPAIGGARSFGPAPSFQMNGGVPSPPALGPGAFAPSGPGVFAPSGIPAPSTPVLRGSGGSSGGGGGGRGRGQR